MAREFDRAFDGFGAGVGEEDALSAWAWGDCGQALADSGHAFIVEIAAADVEEFFGGGFDRRDDFGVTIACRRYGYARHEVEIAVAIDIFYHHAAAACDRQRILFDIGRRCPGAVSRHNIARFRARRRDNYTG